MVSHIQGVTSHVFREQAITNVSVSIDHVVSMIPRTFGNSSDSEAPMDFGVYIVCDKSSISCTRSKSSLLKANKDVEPDIFPLDSSQESDGFIAVKQRGKSKGDSTAKQVNQPKQVNLTDCITRINTNPVISNITKDTVWVTDGGRGGTRSIMVHMDYFGPLGAKFVSQGVSGGSVRRFDNLAEGLAYVNILVPGVDSIEKLCRLYRFVPHVETNISPTNPPHVGKVYHRAGAAAYCRSFVRLQDLFKWENCGTLIFTNMVYTSEQTRH
jgi:hypothetical protein